MNKAVYLLLAVSPIVLAACTTTPDCLKPRPYMNAKSFPPLKSPAGLDVPQPDPSMQVPEVVSGPVGAFEQAPRGTNSKDPAARCLVTPPPMASSQP